MRVDLAGAKTMESPFEINPAGFTIHSCIHGARHDAACVMHTHSLDGMAVSAQRDGLLPISQFAFSVLHSLSYHDYEGLALNTEEKPQLVANLGESNFLMLRNHSLLIIGSSVAEAFQAM